MSTPDTYGSRYYCIKVTKDVSKSGEIYAYADEIKTNGDGSLALWTQREGKESFVNLLIASGKWRAFYAASCLDGSAVSVEHWQGEVERG